MIRNPARPATCNFAFRAGDYARGMLLGLLRWGSRAAIPTLAFAFLRELWEPGAQLSSGWRAVLGIALVAAIVIAIVTWEPVLKLIRGGPTLAAGEFTEFTRDAVGGPGLQVLGVEIYNERESGGEGRWAVDVVPEVVALTLNGANAAGPERGVWFRDRNGSEVETVTFRPTRVERHAVELAGKYPDAADAWLAGERDPPSLTPGIYEVRVTLRGGNLKPRTLKFFLRNPGVGGRLSAAKSCKDLESISEVSSPVVPEEAKPTTDGALEAEAETPEPALDPEPLEDPLAEIDALVAERDDLERKLWERVKVIKRSGSLMVLGAEYLGEVRAWNKRVLRLADEYLPLKEAALVDTIAGWTSVMTGPDRVEALLQSNTTVLGRIRGIVERGRTVEKKN